MPAATHTLATDPGADSPRAHRVASRDVYFVMMLAIIGIVLALVEIAGVLPDGNRAALVTLWAITALPVAWLVSRARSFLVGFLVGVSMVAAAHLTTFLFWNEYTARNPQYVTTWLEGARRVDLSARAYELATIIPVGLMYGVAIGGVAWLLARTRVSRRASPRRG